MAPKHPTPAAGAFIRNQKGQLLLVKGFKWPDLWHVPGGKVKWGESYQETLKREVKEEVGVEVEKIKLFNFLEAIFPPQFHKKSHFLFIECECYIKPGEKIKLDQRELSQYKWFNLEQALKENIDKWTKNSIKKLINGHSSVVASPRVELFEPGDEV